MVDDKNNFDVIIVGAGPAGCTAAFNLAKEGHRVAILEKSDATKKKPCGGGLTVRILERFPDFKTEIERISFGAVYETDLYSPEFNMVRSRLKKPMTLMVKRDEFDSAMLNLCRNSGVYIFENSEVKKVGFNQGGVEIFIGKGENFESKAIIGADGVNSLVRQEAGLGAGWAKDDISICIVGS